MKTNLGFLPCPPLRPRRSDGNDCTEGPESFGGIGFSGWHGREIRVSKIEVEGGG